MQDKTGKLEEGTPGSSDTASAARLGQTVADAALASGEPKWTPGAWAAYDRGIGWEVVVPDLRFGTRNLNDGFRETFTKADAQMVAAAREMYEALEAIVRKFDDRYVGALYSELIAARAALAKARGEKPESTSTEPDEG